MNWYKELIEEDLEDEPELYAICKIVGIEKMQEVMKIMQCEVVRFKQLRHIKKFTKRMVEKYPKQKVKDGLLQYRTYTKVLLCNANIKKCA